MGSEVSIRTVRKHPQLWDPSVHLQNHKTEGEPIPCHMPIIAVMVLLLPKSVIFGGDHTPTEIIRKLMKLCDYDAAKENQIHCISFICHRIHNFYSVAEMACYWQSDSSFNCLVVSVNMPCPCRRNTMGARNKTMVQSLADNI